MATQVSCPKCSTAMTQSGFKVWQIILFVLLLGPLGLLIILANLVPSKCSNCGFSRRNSNMFTALFTIIGTILGALCSYLLYGVRMASFAEWFTEGFGSEQTALAIIISTVIGLFIGLAAGIIIDKLYEK